jgi:SAM-dependent methyltransferase
VNDGQAAAQFDRYADDYREVVQRSIDFSGLDHELFTRRKALHVLDLARRRLGRPDRLRALDVGCGIGLTDVHLAGRFAVLEGADTSAEALRHAAAANPAVRYSRYDSDGKMPYEDGSFDLAFAICVVHHVPPRERKNLVAELGRVVRSGGVVAIFEHNPRNPLTRLAVARCTFDADATLLDPGGVTRLLEVGGLRPVERRYVLAFPSNRRRIVALEGVLARLPLGAQYYVAAAR